MRCFLKRNAIDCIKEMEITETAFNDLKEAKRVLRKALDIEDKYELLISTYLELEKDALSLSVNYMVLHDSSYIEIQKKRNLINKRLVALLTTARLYLDRIASEAYSCTKTKSDKKKVKAFTSEKYDSLKEYRFVEALRNSVQHHSLPIHGMNFGAQRVEGKTGSANQYTSSFFANKVEFEQTKSFKKSVLDEMPDQVDILNEIRVYISAISHIHSQVRELIDEAVKASRQTLEEIISQYEVSDSGNTLGLVAVCEVSEEDYEAVPVLLDWDDVRISLVKKNKHLINLQKRFIRS
jgi:hypothetical protein